MTKISYEKRFLSFKDSVCPYCNGKATLLETIKGKYSGQCSNPECRAHNNFTNKKCKEWAQE
jgi:uncharacterized protein YbaR (Trm112 family)